MAKDNWSDEETRYFFQLYAEERRKGNRTNIGMNQTGKLNIIKNFEERFKKKYDKWNPFKNRYDACKKKYTSVRILTHNRTELQYDDMGRLTMGDDWWKQRELEWPGAKKHKIRRDANLDVYEEEFKAVVVTGAEGWSAASGEASLSLNSTGDGDDFDEANSVDKEFPVPETQNQTQTQSGSSRAQKRRKEKKDIAIETVAKRTESIVEKSNVAKQYMEYEPSFPHPPSGKYYLVDSGYPTRTGYLGPHRGLRYHLGQFARGGPPVTARELFNRKHSGLRSVIERTFGVWKAKWRILDRRHPKYGLTKWIKLVTATMALHNFIRDSHREDQDFVHWQSTEEYQGDEEEGEGEGEGEVEGEVGGEGEEEEEEGEGEEEEHVEYQPTGDIVMEALRTNITNEYGQGRLPY